MKVSIILQAKGFEVFSIASNATVYDALVLMGKKNIGAVLVIDNHQLVGILSERDYARKIILKGKTSHDTLVKEIMSVNAITITAQESIDDCMNLMSQNHIRHLPVVENGVVLGMVSIGDVVKTIIQLQQDTIHHLQNYILQ
jgi:CBS domain-containing protein